FVFELRMLGGNVVSPQGFDVYNYVQPPVVTRVSSADCFDVGSGTTNCSTTGGQLVSVTGQFFGTNPNVFFSVSIGGNLCTDVQNQQDTSFTCRAPQGTGVNLAVVVTAGSKFSQPALLFSYGAASIDAVSGCVPD